ncbi:nuclear condensing complex subunit [Mycena rebaudengoi]|nr:nuclear condensing complex subunit [Mycena rebaudengoi]
MPARTLPTGVDLATALARVFDQAQTSTANHQKNFVALHKLHLGAAKKKEPVKNGFKLTGEREFEAMFTDMLTRVLQVKKGATTADRIVKFVGGYIKFVNLKTPDDRPETENAADEDDEDTDTTASRFIARLLKFLLKGFLAKDKIVRYRVIFIVAEMVAHLGELDEDIYAELRTALLDRIRDKEVMIRVQVVIALSKLAGSENANELDEGEKTVLDILLDTLVSDPSPEVRRATMLNIPVTFREHPDAPHAHPRLPTTQSASSYIASVFDGADSRAVDPRVLTIAQRELLVRNGLGDREKTVRSAAATMIGNWVGVLGEESDEELASRLADVDISDNEAKPPITVEEKQAKIIKTLSAFLKMFDLNDPAALEEVGKLASDALRSAFDTQPEIFNDLFFGDAYFEDLTPEKIFLARVFVEHCAFLDREEKGRGEQRIEGAGIPVVTSCAFRIQAGYNDLAAAEEDREASRGVEDEEEREKREDKEFVVGEMLKLAVSLDYADEIGRRKMFALVRDMLTRPTLPPSLVGRCLDVLRQLSSDERDLIRVVVEIVHDLRDTGDDEDDAGATDDPDASFDSEKPKKPVKTRDDLSPEEQVRADKIDLRCLALCIGMLERVNGTVDQNSTLEGILGDLIIPSVKNKDVVFREKGLVSLGLFCLISKSLAIKSLPLFVSQAEAPNVPEVFRLSLLQIIFDLLMVHGPRILGAENTETALNFLVLQLQEESDKEDTSDKILGLLSTGIAKLLISGMITDERAIKTLLMVYFSPYNAENQELKQCVSFFIPIFSHSSQKNQKLMREIFIPIFQKVAKLREDLQDEEEVISSTHLTYMWLEWTDPTQMMDVDKAGEPGKAGDPLIQFEMVNDIVRALLTEDMTKEDKKVLCQMLGKLYIPDEVDDDKIRTLKLLMHTLTLRRPFREAVTKNAFNKFDATISKKFEKQLEDFNEEEYRKMEELKELFEFLDDIIPEDDDEVIDVEVKKKGKKRRSDSIVSVTTDGEDGVSTTSSVRGRSKPKAKRRRLSTSDDEESDFDGSDDRTPKGTPPPPTRKLPRRSAAVKKTPQVIIPDDSDEDEDEEDDVEDTPAPKRRSQATKTRKAQEEAAVDEDIDNLLDDGPSMEIPQDSIMDDSDEEDEVNDLLVED